ncbi:iron chaperone [Culicoidibacter larvae]|uniref:Iron chaperone n=1 Tax=Culicoidibacter larvae TaxID=2579976 RepID=A0A5R8QF37_9FIRM|nr:iron chaperone [Culicoidibacter larvae]TLG76649.1 iron chaperone [Culicoidibacter larvae]
MDTFAEYLAAVDNPEHRARLEAIFAWIDSEFPNLEKRIAWNQPMYTDHETFIIGFSISKQHLAFSPEGVVLDHFAPKIKAAGYKQTKMLVQIPWTSEVNYDLLKEIIAFNIEDKKDITTFWRK